MHGATLFLGEEVCGAAQMVPYEVVEDDDQHDGDSPREEGSYPHNNCSVHLVAVVTPGQRHIYPVHGEIDRGDGIDPAQRHGGEVRHQDDGNTGQFSDPGLGEVLLGRRAAKNEVALDGEHRHDPGGAVERSILQEPQDGTPGIGVPKGLQ